MQAQSSVVQLRTANRRVLKYEKLTESAEFSKNSGRPIIFFVQCEDRAVCLISKESAAVFKEYNLRRQGQKILLKGQVGSDNVIPREKHLETPWCRTFQAKQ
ncbi:hypothetical protein NL108_012059 [Boleophthalmus pectinirostris]|nr:hypothetical protein NL108_012059 [Boleophthalmus pectinirostris]